MPPIALRPRLSRSLTQVNNTAAATRQTSGASSRSEEEMTLKSILVVVSGGDDDGSRLDTAFAWAAKHRAKLAALYAMPSPMIYAGGPGVEMPASIIEAQQREAEAAEKLVERATKKRAEHAGADLEWRSEEGDDVALAGIHGRYADLVIASPELARDLVFGAGAPVLAVPAGVTAAPAKRVLVAWNGSREAARAVRDALPLLKTADSVEVSVIDPPEGRAIGEGLATMLARHGIPVAVREALSQGNDVGAMLLEQAKTGGADLIVMGAYGHSRFREWVLGGATEEVLAESKIPVLVSH
jgi:nucleotide-binding universal stress UspA family protein